MSKEKVIWKKPTFFEENVSLQEPRRKRLSSKLTNSTNKSLNTKINLNEDFSNNNKRNKLTKSQINSSDWIDKFLPLNIEDLAVHAKKIYELEDWLKHCDVKNRVHGGQIALITGPSGCGKTAAVRVIANKMQYNVAEWVNPLDLDLISDESSGSTFKESQIDIFKRFLFRSSRYNSLFNSSGKKLIIVEDFPNIFIKSSEGFTEILESYKNYGKSPLIFIVTDSKGRQLNMSYNLFPNDVCNQYQIKNINFNAISISLMNKAIKRICSIMAKEEFKNDYKIPKQEIVDSISQTAMGDLRNAIINLHFASLIGAPQLQTETKKDFSATNKSRSKNNKVLSFVGRDETITMMHALGRVFNPKYDKEMKFLHSPEIITESFSSQPKTFMDFIFENYLSHFSNIDYILGAIENLSQSDVLMTEYIEDQIRILGLNLVIRGMMVHNEKPVSAWLPVRGLKRMKSDYDYHSELKNYGIKENVSKNIIIADYRSYANIIIKK